MVGLCAFMDLGIAKGTFFRRLALRLFLRGRIDDFRMCGFYGFVMCEERGCGMVASRGI